MRKVLLLFLVSLIGTTSMAESIEDVTQVNKLSRPTDLGEQKVVGIYKYMRLQYKKFPSFLDPALSLDNELAYVDNLVAFMRASKVCFEKTGEDQFRNQSKNCDVVRESATNEQARILSSALNISADEMVALVDAGDEAISIALSKKGLTRQLLNLKLWMNVYRMYASKISTLHGEMFYKSVPTLKAPKEFDRVMEVMEKKNPNRN